MVDKKHQGRFCIQFNPADPRHLQVIELLEAQSRRKAQFIVEAVLYYTGASQETSGIVNPSQLKNMVEALVKEYLQKETKPGYSSARAKPRDDAPDPARSTGEPALAADDGGLRDIVHGLMATLRTD